VSVRNSVRQGESDYYYLPIDITGKDVTITVTSLSGDPDLYVSLNNQFPNITTARWMSPGSER
jgi:hypothetical protein